MIRLPLGVCRMRVRNPDAAANSLSGNNRIMWIFQYLDPPESGITGFRNQDKASEGRRREKRTRVCRRQSIDRGWLTSAGEREGGRSVPGCMC